jgi:hypothetical protein
LTNFLVVFSCLIFLKTGKTLFSIVGSEEETLLTGPGVRGRRPEVTGPGTEEVEVTGEIKNG